ACRPPLPSCFSLYLSLVPPSPLLFPYTTLFRSRAVRLQRPLLARGAVAGSLVELGTLGRRLVRCLEALSAVDVDQCENVSGDARSEEHTSELQSHLNLVCRLLLEKKNIQNLHD